MPQAHRRPRPRPTPRPGTPCGRRRTYRPRAELLEGRVLLSATLVKDLNLGTAPAFPPGGMDPAVLGGKLYFAADDGVHGVELWKSDGTAAGTALVKDIDPGRSLDIPGGPNSSNPTDLTVVNGTLFFTADDGAHGPQLWRSDGTAAGTRMVANLPAATDPDVNPLFGNAGPSQLTAFGGKLFFIDTVGATTQLWKSDGTAAGTVPVKDFGNPLPLLNTVGGLTVLKGTLFFSAPLPGTGLVLWKSDGTKAGTVPVQDAKHGTVATGPIGLTAVGNKLFFAADDGVNGTELWQSDGTAGGTKMVKDINPGSAGSLPAGLTNVNGTLFFTADDGVHGVELWRSDGTAAGTRLVKDIDPGAPFALPGLPAVEFGSSPEQLTGVGGKLYFTADDGSHGRELWESDGTAAGTKLVKDVNTGSTDPGGGLGPQPDSSNPSDLTDFRGTLYFTATDGVGGNELWRSDGTAAGTVLVRTLGPAPSPLDPTPVFAGLTPVGGTLFFAADDGVHGMELWRTDGTAAGTRMVKDVNTTPRGSSPNNFAAVNGTLFFTADDGAHGTELWKSDGTAAGTALVKDVYPGVTPYGPNTSSPTNLTDVNGTLFFTANDGHALGLWKSNGTAAGTVLVKEIGPNAPFSPDGSNPWNPWFIHDLTAVNGTVFFVAEGGTDTELWRSDGTAAGTVLLQDIQPGAGGLDELTAVGRTLFFVDGDAAHGRELWKSDGTKAGTKMVKDINPGAGDSNPDGLTNFGGKLYFAADDGTHGRQLWRSDGTAAGTTLVAVINPHGDAFPPVVGLLSIPSFTVAGGNFFFPADDGVHGDELWKSDGTKAGTVLVKDIHPGSGPAPFSGSVGPYGSGVGDLTAVNGAVFFTADDGVHGDELWRTDGTAAGTKLVKDIFPGSGPAFAPMPNSSFPLFLTAAGGKLLFTADDGVHGRELWRSDGTAAGTALVQDIGPGPASGVAAEPLPGVLMPALVNVRGTVFFVADDGTHGSELWKMTATP